MSLRNNLHIQYMKMLNIYFKLFQNITIFTVFFFYKVSLLFFLMFFYFIKKINNSKRFIYTERENEEK